MSFLEQLNAPALVLGSGLVILGGIPAATTTLSAASLPVLQATVLSTFALNLASVSLPGRIDGQSQLDDSSSDKTYQDVYSPTKGRSLVAPAGWTFAVWGPIFLGEAVFSGAAVLSKLGANASAILPFIAAPFAAANLVQSLWCASFRPKYYSSDSAWHKYVSAVMLGGTAYSLSRVHALSCSTRTAPILIPLTMHFAWTTAATLVNVNGSLAASPGISDAVVIGAGHASVLAATLLGVGITLTRASPVYGLTIAWALAGCASGMRQRASNNDAGDAIQSSMKVQGYLCVIGSILSAISAAYIMLK